MTRPRECLTTNSRVVDSFAECTGNHDGMPPEEIPVIIPELKGASGINDDRFEGDSLEKVLGAELRFILLQPCPILELKQLPHHVLTNFGVPSLLVPPELPGVRKDGVRKCLVLRV